MKIEAYSEFGFILWYYLPKSYYLHTQNKLQSTESRIGSREVFYFSKNHSEQDIVYDPPKFSPESNTCYSHEPPNFTKDSWLPPPLKEHYKNNRFIFDKPLVTIHNKTTLEWKDSGIYNYFNSEGLEKIIRTLSEKYTIVYIRPPKQNTETYVGDHGQKVIDIGDEEIIKKYNVIFINDLLEQNKDLTYNELQFMLLANSEKHITSAGEAVIPAYFGGETLIYTCPDCKATERGVWKSNSWMKMLSNSKIVGYNNYDDIKDYIEKNWMQTGKAEKNLDNKTIETSKKYNYSMDNGSIKMNIITRCSRKDKFIKTLNSINRQDYENITHYITYQRDDIYDFLKKIDFKYNTVLIRVPDFKKIKNLHIMYELDDASVDYLNPDWEFIERRVVTNIDEFEVEKNNNKNRKQVESQIYEKNGFWCTSLNHTLLRLSTHFPYNLYIKTAEQNIDNGWILYLDDDDFIIGENKITNLVGEIEKYDDDTIHIFKMKREPGTVPSDKFFKYMETGHPILYGEVGSSCICFHSKYKDYTVWDEWSNADYRTIKVLEKVIPNKNFFNEIIINASKSGQITE